jgi:hypothetical protein
MELPDEAYTTLGGDMKSCKILNGACFAFVCLVLSWGGGKGAAQGFEWLVDGLMNQFRVGVVVAARIMCVDY